MRKCPINVIIFVLSSLDAFLICIKSFAVNYNKPLGDKHAHTSGVNTSHQTNGGIYYKLATRCVYIHISPYLDGLSTNLESSYLNR